MPSGGYKLAAFRDPVFVVSRTLPDAEANQVLEALKVLDKFDLDQQLYLVARHNYSELVDGFNRYKQAFSTRGNLGRTEALKIRFDMNRRTLNFLSSFRSFLDQSEHYISRRFGRESKEWHAFEKCRQHEYDSSAYHRIAYKLRDYAQHYGPPVENFSASAEVHDDGTKTFSFDLSVDRESLLTSGFDWKKKVRDDLESATGDFPLLDLMQSVRESLDRLAAKRIEFESASPVKALNVLLPLVREVQSNGYPCLLPADFGDATGPSSIAWFPMTTVLNMLASIHAAQKTNYL